MKSLRQTPRFPLVKLPQDADQTLFLIREELKSQRFFSTLYELGIDDCHYQVCLGELILANMGLDDGSDETNEFYWKIIEKRSKKLKGDYDSLMKQSFKVYMELMEEKRRR